MTDKTVLIMKGTDDIYTKKTNGFKTTVWKRYNIREIINYRELLKAVLVVI